MPRTIDNLEEWNAWKKEKIARKKFFCDLEAKAKMREVVNSSKMCRGSKTYVEKNRHMSPGRIEDRLINYGNYVKAKLITARCQEKNVVRSPRINKKS